MAAILNATTPLFGAIMGAFWLGEPLRVRKVTGIAIALTGVGITVGWAPLALNGATVAAILASLLAALCYALSGAYTKAKLTGAPPMGMAVGTLGAASLILLPVAPFAWPASPPSAAAIWCALGLALVSTALAYILYFRLVVDVGPTRALTVTFLTPVFGLLWGALFLHEPVHWSKLLGCAIVLVGTALVTETNPRRALGLGVPNHEVQP
jgi:drug/metabolite transporter (DMT)-like permease